MCAEVSTRGDSLRQGRRERGEDTVFHVKHGGVRSTEARHLPVSASSPKAVDG